MNPGRLDRRITFQELTVTRGDAGSAVESFTDILLTPTVWAEKVTETSREFRAAAARHDDIAILFRIRYRSDITGKHRLTYAGKTYEVIGTPVEEGRRETLLIAARHTEGHA